MKKTIFFPIIAIVMVSALLLSVSFGVKGMANRNVNEARLKEMQTLLPGSKIFIEEDYTGEDDNIRSIHKAENGYVIETVVYGYAGDITMMIGVNNQGYVTGIVVTDMSDTVGLGANALTDHKFLAQFLNVNRKVAIGATDSTNAFSSATDTMDSTDSIYVDGITGATVTSKAIAKSINSAIAFVTGADVESSATSQMWDSRLNMR